LLFGGFHAAMASIETISNDGGAQISNRFYMSVVLSLAHPKGPWNDSEPRGGVPREESKKIPKISNLSNFFSAATPPAT
jgi:hypothetical protein